MCLRTHSDRDRTSLIPSLATKNNPIPRNAAAALPRGLGCHRHPCSHVIWCNHPLSFSRVFRSTSQHLRIDGRFSHTPLNPGLWHVICRSGTYTDYSINVHDRVDTLRLVSNGTPVPALRAGASQTVGHAYILLAGPRT